MIARGLAWATLLASLVWLAIFCTNVAGGYTFENKATRAGLLLTSVPLVLVALAFAVRLQTRVIGLAAMLLVLIGGPACLYYSDTRFQNALSKVEAIYDEIAARGPPFPESIDREKYEVPEFLHWYYQKNSETEFAVFYLHSSDGYAMEYPRGTWEHRGYYPNGYGVKRPEPE